MISKLAKDLTLIIYDTPSPPKCIKINKAALKVLLVIFPIIVIVSLTVSIYFLSNVQRSSYQGTSPQPKKVKELESQLAETKSLLVQKESIANELQKKIADGTKSTETTLSIFKTPLGFKDLSQVTNAKIDNIKFEHQQSLSTISFNLVNNQENAEKLTGHIFVIQIGPASLKFYPETALQTGDFVLRYNTGEAFTASRFRPVIAKFKNDANEEISYRVYIFSRSGDLLMNQLLGPFNTNE
jgi:hypothetical protein